LSSISHFCFFRLMYYQLTLAYDFCCVSLLHVRQIRLSFQFALFTFFYMGLLIVSFTATARTEPKLPVNRSFGWLVGLKLSPKPTFELFLLARACFFQRACVFLKWSKMVLIPFCKFLIDRRLVAARNSGANAKSKTVPKP